MSKNTKTKICGITTKETLLSCIKGGAEYIGFVFYKKSARNISIEKANELVKEIKGKLKIVALIVDATNDEISRIISAINPDFLQCHGNENIDRLQEIKDKFSIPIIKAVNIGSYQDLNNYKKYQNVADMFLFDSKSKDSDFLGGQGVSFDWKIMNEFKCSKPWMLAGGLNINNVKQAIEETNAKIIDLSSGVEIKKGVKSSIKIKDLLKFIELL